MATLSRIKARFKVEYFSRGTFHDRNRTHRRSNGSVLPFRVAPAHALELNEAIENCRSNRRQAIVMACMREGGGNLEACRASASPKVKACVQSAMLASRPKAALFDAAKVSAPKPAKPRRLAAHWQQGACEFVALRAPSRTSRPFSISKSPMPRELRNSRRPPMPTCPRD